METLKKHWILILFLLLLIGIAIWHFLLRKKPVATPNPASLPTPAPYTQVGGIDKNGCDSASRDVNGNPCTRYEAPILLIKKATYQNQLGTKSKDVTSILQSYVSDGAINIKALASGWLMNDLFGDAAPNELKFLNVQYSLNGANSFVSIKGTDGIVIP